MRGNNVICVPDEIINCDDRLLLVNQRVYWITVQPVAACNAFVLHGALPVERDDRVYGRVSSEIKISPARLS